MSQFNRIFNPSLFFSIIDFSTIMTSIDETIVDLNLQEMFNIRETIKKHKLVKSTLKKRWKDQTKFSQTVVYQSKHRLTQMKEEILITQINRLIDRDISSTNQIVRNLTKEMIQESVDKNWAKNFINRNKNRLKSIYLKNINNDRITSEYAFMFKQFYDLISELNLKFETKCLHFYQLIEYIEKYNIIVDFIYNWDEKDFLIDYAFVIKRIMSLKAYESNRITHALQNNNREFISLLTCICVNDIVLLFVLIYRNKSIQDTWLNDWNKNEQTFFAISFHDWSCDELEYKWLM